MWVRFIVLASLLTVTGSCSLSKEVEPRQSEWFATRPDATDLTTAKNTCENEALEQAKSARRSGIAAKAAGGTYLKCMAEQGWELREVESDE